MKVLGVFVLVASLAAAATNAAADPVVDAFYNRCVSGGAERAGGRLRLHGAGHGLAPDDDARPQLDEAIKTSAPVSLGGSPFKGNPADLARNANGRTSERRCTPRNAPAATRPRRSAKR